MWIGWCISIGVCSWRYVELSTLLSFSLPFLPCGESDDVDGREGRAEQS